MHGESESTVKQLLCVRNTLTSSPYAGLTVLLVTGPCLCGGNGGMMWMEKWCVLVCLLTCAYPGLSYILDYRN